MSSPEVALPPEVQALLRGFLRSGERVLWSGQPNVNAYILRGALFVVPFSIFWLGFMIFWEAGALSSRAPFPFALFGIPFIAIGLYMVFGRFVVAAREAERALYAVTDRRVIILIGAFRQTFVEMALVDLPPMQLTQERSGSGTITFGVATTPVRLPPGWPGAGMYARPLAFESISDVSKVYAIVQDARANARPHVSLPTDL